MIESNKSLKITSNAHTHKNGLVSAYSFTAYSITEENQGRNSVRAGTQRKELMKRLWTGTVYWLALHGLVILFS